MSYGVTVDVLEEILPIGAQLNATTVQRHLLRVAERVEQELGGFCRNFWCVADLR